MPKAVDPSDSCVFPLDGFYARGGLPLPPVCVLAPRELPEPDRSLLVHPHDMTSSLRRHHGESIHIRALHRERRGDFYFREVVLVLDDSRRRVEFGAIRINLALFEAAAREVILENHLPLGHILLKYRVPFTSRPASFFSLRADDFISRALEMKPGTILYGRRNNLLNPRRKILAEVVEILPRA